MRSARSAAAAAASRRTGGFKGRFSCGRVSASAETSMRSGMVVLLLPLRVASSPSAEREGALRYGASRACSAAEISGGRAFQRSSCTRTYAGIVMTLRVARPAQQRAVSHPAWEKKPKTAFRNTFRHFFSPASRRRRLVQRRRRRERRGRWLPCAGIPAHRVSTSKTGGEAHISGLVIAVALRVSQRRVCRHTRGWCSRSTLVRTLRMPAEC